MNKLLNRAICYDNVPGLGCSNPVAVDNRLVVGSRHS